MSIIEDVFARAGLTEVKVEDLRPGDRFIMRQPEEDAIYEGIADGIDGYLLRCRDSLGLSIYEDQAWYLVERAPVEEPTGWGAIVEVDGVKYTRVPDDPQDGYQWAARSDDWYDWDDLTSLGTPNVLFEGISE